MLLSAFATVKIQPVPLHRSHGFFQSRFNYRFCARCVASPNQSSLYVEKALELMAEAEPGKRQIRGIRADNVAKAIDVLSKYGFDFEEVSSCIKKYRTVLIRDFKEVERVFEFFTSVGFTDEDIKKVILKFPKAISASYTNTKSLFEYLHEVVDFSKEDFFQFILKRPSTLTLSVKTKIIPSCEFFSTKLAVEKQYLKKILMNLPQILAYSLEDKIKPIVHYIEEELGVPHEILIKRVRYTPALFSRSVKGLQSRAQWMRDELGCSNHDLARICASSLSVFTYSLPTLRMKVANLAKQLELSPEEAALVIKTYPLLAIISKEKLKSTVDYITNTMSRDIKEVVSSPGVLSYSLENRIKPRFEVLKLKGIPHQQYSLSTLFVPTEKTFQLFVQRQLES